jgi:hypothetical protein
LGIHDKSGKLRLVYSAPVIKLPSGKTGTPDLEWDPTSSSISISLPDLSFPLVIAFGLGVKFPEAKGGFNLHFPSFKFGAKGEIEDSSSDSDSDDEEKKKGGFGIGIKPPKFGFGKKDKSVDVGLDKPKLNTSGGLPHTESSGKIKVGKKPKTKNQKPKTKNQKPKTKNQKPKTKNQKPKTKNQKPNNASE